MICNNVNDIKNKSYEFYGCDKCDKVVKYEKTTWDKIGDTVDKTRLRFHDMDNFASIIAIIRLFFRM